MDPGSEMAKIVDHRVFADIVKDRRAELGWAQGALAKRIGVGQQTVSRWESGDAVPRPRTVREIASVLGLDAGLLLVKAGYLESGEMPDSVEGRGSLDRIAAKYAQLDPQSQATIDTMIDVMLRQQEARQP